MGQPLPPCTPIGKPVSFLGSHVFVGSFNPPATQLLLFQTTAITKISFLQVLLIFLKNAYGELCRVDGEFREIENRFGGTSRGCLEEGSLSKFNSIDT